MSLTLMHDALILTLNPESNVIDGVSPPTREVTFCAS
jgi:hypothetical protein